MEVNAGLQSARIDATHMFLEHRHEQGRPLPHTHRRNLFQLHAPAVRALVLGQHDPHGREDSWRDPPARPHLHASDVLAEPLSDPLHLALGLHVLIPCCYPLRARDEVLRRHDRAVFALRLFGLLVGLALRGVRARLGR